MDNMNGIYYIFTVSLLIINFHIVNSPLNKIKKKLDIKDDE